MPNPCPPRLLETLLLSPVNLRIHGISEEFSVSCMLLSSRWFLVSFLVYLLDDVDALREVLDTNAARWLSIRCDRNSTKP